ncbi:hypothetical protein KFU94_46725 [Chloroflexi bacterium TSY]|nr:hypothetical protein [Chloroflexi bacterium TSY]
MDEQIEQLTDIETNYDTAIEEASKFEIHHGAVSDHTTDTTANFPFFKETKLGNSDVFIACKSIYEQIREISTSRDLSLKEQEGIGAICLGNYIDQATKFTILGGQEGRIVERAYTVEPFRLVWTLGWETGDDKLVLVQMGGGLDAFIPIAPFRSTTSIALYRK